MSMKQRIDSHREQYMSLLAATRFMMNRKDASPEQWYEAVLGVLQTIKANRQRLFFIGNGASCSMASHFAVDFTKNAGIRSFSCNDGALLTCFSNDFSFETSYAEMLKHYMQPGDALIAISSSGTSKNIVTAADYCKKTAGNTVITLSGFALPNPLLNAGDYGLFVGNNSYGFVESIHAYFLHQLIDLFVGPARG